MRKIKYIIIHCSATPVNRDYTEKDLERDHLNRGIRAPGGYHFYIRKDGTVVKLRELEEVGAHARPYNSHSIGICYEGGIKAGGRDWRDAADTRTEQQKAALLEVIHLCIQWILANRNGDGTKIAGHGQLPGVTKACPSFDAEKEYSWITC